MSKKANFIDYLETVVNEADMSENVLSYWTAFKTKTETVKPKFTDNGKLVMEYLQGLPYDTNAMSAKTIADNMFISSRTVSGTMRKLVTDGWVQRNGEDPVMYSLSETGKTVSLDD